MALAENERIGEEGERVMVVARRDYDPETFDPKADLLQIVKDLDAPGHRRHRRSAAR